MADYLNALTKPLNQMTKEELVNVLLQLILLSRA